MIVDSADRHTDRDELEAADAASVDYGPIRDLAAPYDVMSPYIAPAHYAYLSPWLRPRSHSYEYCTYEYDLLSYGLFTVCFRTPLLAPGTVCLIWSLPHLP